MEATTIIQECKNNQPWAQKALFERFAPVMMNVCRRYIGNHHDSEEVMLSGFMQFFEKIKLFEYRGEGSIQAYLGRIMVNQSLMFLRKHQTMVYADLQENFISESQDALDELSAQEIMRLITALPTGYRVVFNLFVIEGLSHQQIAELLQIKEGTSKSQLSKARRLLQQMITKMENHGIQTK
ncbi:RNA polymerase sigma-70 factor, ECF subfamily [Arachidicoccus rhizosphaerae]|uniref:RNA polymerase sigma-70 factor, ECF subfamily n=1 Tax=Arachidicoccus rhizosphaerae TaxID=551991 RepID=A0A1H3W4K3_9BACT|nr:sigma-70 family RNA polymerase sigma factor [Arachidicoccus rhizosphaerae]SDZ81354.1 RNA polymerase sigma-70 factor, ECF subfamily [Arachidicoccus rhizosphaerae]